MMDKFQATFEILWILSMIEGYVDKREAGVISQFINDNLGRIHFDRQDIVDSLLQLTSEGQREELAKAASLVHKMCSAQEKVTILDFAFRLIVADGYLHEAELEAFTTLGSVWNIDIKEFMQRYMK